MNLSLTVKSVNFIFYFFLSRIQISELVFDVTYCVQTQQNYTNTMKMNIQTSETLFKLMELWFINVKFVILSWHPEPESYNTIQKSIKD